MRTSTSGGPTSVAETWTAAELIRSGWTEADLAWETASEAVLSALAEGELEAAKADSARALRLAREDFRSDDPRLGTSLANHAACLRAAGDDSAAEKLQAESRQVWQACDPWIAEMTAPRVARSSLFHARMEQRHRETYEARWREKWMELVQEARNRLRQVEGAGGSVSPRDSLARWRRERPAMLNDSRKLLAAAILIAPERG